MKQQTIRLILLTLLACLWPAATFAHGGGTPRLTNVEAGPYQLYVWSSPETPRVGETHITIGVTQRGNDGEERPADVAVQVTLTSDDAVSSPIVREAMRGNTAADVYHEADVEIPAAGTWQISVRAEGEAGVGEANYQQTVLPARSLSWWLVGGVGVALLLAIGLGRLAGRRGTPAAVGGAAGINRVSSRAPANSVNKAT